MRRLLVFGWIVLGLASMAYSENEMRAIHDQMKAAKAIRCGLTYEELWAAYTGCRGASVCDASAHIVGEAGPCTRALRFNGTGGDDPWIELNGMRFPVPTKLPPNRKGKDLEVGS